MYRELGSGVGGQGSGKPGSTFDSLSNAPTVSGSGCGNSHPSPNSGRGDGGEGRLSQKPDSDLVLNAVLLGNGNEVSAVQTLRIGAPYFNARPLVWDFIERPSPDLFLMEDAPTRLAGLLRAGEIDAALISSVEAYRGGDLDILPGIGVASRGAVWSIKLFHQKPLDKVESVALDTSSYTSAALTRILLAERYGNSPEFVNLPPDLNAMLARCDAALLIGDPGFRASHGTVPYVDLGAEWFAWTGLPFVYAVWAGRPGIFGEGLGDRLYSSAEYGLARLNAIVEAEAEARSLDPALCRDYLGSVIRYRIESEEKSGLERFLSLSEKHGLLSRAQTPAG